MLETELRELFERQASAEQPPSRLNIQAVSRAARVRLRLRRLACTATTLVVAGAVAVVAATYGPQAGRAVPVGPGHRHHPERHALGPSAPRYFDPRREYLSFGWLPPRTRVFSGDTGTTEQDLIAGRPGDMTLVLLAYAAGQCSLAHMRFHCVGQNPGSDLHLTTRLPDIEGHPAYWSVIGHGVLIWRYARGGWAKLDFRPRSYAVRVAEHVIFGGPTPPLKFPARLTGMPGWHLSSALFDTGRHGSLAINYEFATGAGLRDSASSARYPTVIVGSPESCYFDRGESTQSMITGYLVTLTRQPPPREARYVCAANADGLSVQVVVAGWPLAVSPTKIFAHLKLLGPDPANWTTKPVG